MTANPGIAARDGERLGQRDNGFHEHHVAEFFTTGPAPGGPQWVMSVAKFASSVRSLAKTFGVAPTMTLSVPCSAAWRAPGIVSQRCPPGFLHKIAADQLTHNVAAKSAAGAHGAAPGAAKAQPPLLAGRNAAWGAARLKGAPVNI